MKKFYEDILKIIQSSSALIYTYFDIKYTYKEFYTNMCKINFLLSRFNNKRIVLFTSKSFEGYCAIFAIILSGNIWVPFSPNVPIKRNIDMLKITEPSILLTDSEIPEEIKEYADQSDADIYYLRDLINSNDYKLFSLGDFNKDDLAYIMFTSGSTGMSKGVPMTHGNYINFVNNALEILPFEKHEVFSDFHEFSFDISIFSLFCCILTESAFAPILKEEERFFPLDNLIKNKVTVWSSVPTVISRIKLLRPDDIIKTSIKIMFLCGEPFKLDILRYCYENMGIKNVYNFYGLTETGVENFYYKCRADDLDKFIEQGFVPIGSPLKGNDILINEDKELLLSGCQVTPGYLGDAGKEKFEIIDGITWYHSGDIVENIGGVYFCKGRLDSQVKISGYRIELMDIESQCRRFEGVRDAVCFVKKIDEYDVLSCILEADNELDVKKLSEFLRQYLMQILIPRKFFIVNEFPRNNNGKINRKAIIEAYNGLV